MLQMGSQEPELSGQPPSEVELMSKNWYYRLPTDDFSQGGSKGRHRFCCCRTQGAAFNLLVGIVLIANAFLIGIEAELGLLGPEGPQWAGLEADMQGVGMNGTGAEEKFVQAELEQGLDADQLVKEKVEQQLKEKMHQNVHVQKDLRLPEGSRKLRSAAYTVCEYFFVTFFLLEMLLRFCDLGCKGYCCDYPWMLLDITVVTTGLLDVLLPFFLEPDVERITVLSLLRMMRVLRLLKLFQVFQPLRMIGRAFSKAFTVVLQVAVVVLVLDFALAVILTSLIGQRSYLWGKGHPEVEVWFGSIGRSMQTLFAVQTLDGWNHIVEVIGEVIPTTVLVPAVVLYMTLCCFTVVGLVTSVITDSFMAAQFREHRVSKVNKDLRRADTKRSLTQLFSSCAKSNPGVLTRTELEAVLNASPIEQMLQNIDVMTSNQDILKLYDQLYQDPAFAGNIKAEHMAQAATSLVGDAQAFSVFDLKHRMVCMSLKAEAAEQEAASQKQEMKKTTMKYEAQILEVKRDVANVSQEMVTLKDQVSAIMTRWDTQSKRQDQERQEHRDAMASVMDSVTALATSHLNLNGKVDVIASQLPAQFTAQSVIDSKVDGLTALLGQVSEQLEALKSETPTKPTSPEAESEAPASEAPSRAEPAAEPPSRNLFSEFDVLIASEAASASLEAAPAKVEQPSLEPVSEAAPACPEAAPTVSEVSTSNFEAALASLKPGSSESQTEAAGGMSAEQWAEQIDMSQQQSNEPVQASLQEQWASFPDLEEKTEQSKANPTGP